MHHPTDRIAHTTAFVTRVVGALAGTRKRHEGGHVSVIHAVVGTGTSFSVCIMFFFPRSLLTFLEVNIFG